MSDLVTWLRAQLDEDERLAKAAQPGKWLSGRTTEPNWGPIVGGELGYQYFAEGERWPKAVTVEGTHVAVNGPGGGMVAQADRTRYRAANVAHIVRHDPARVRAEIEAKRRILEIHLPYQVHGKDWFCSYCHEGFGDDLSMVDAPCPTLQAVLLPYADRPGYLEEWAP